MYVYDDASALIIAELAEDAPEGAVYVEAIPPYPSEGNYELRFDSLKKELYWAVLPDPVIPAPQVDEITLLQAQNKALSDRADFLEDCIAEMAMEVYGGV